MKLIVTNRKDFNDKFQRLTSECQKELFCEKGVLKNFTKFTGKHLRQSIFFDKVADRVQLYLKRGFGTGVFV